MKTRLIFLNFTFQCLKWFLQIQNPLTFKTFVQFGYKGKHFLSEMSVLLLQLLHNTSSYIMREHYIKTERISILTVRVVSRHLSNCLWIYQNCFNQFRYEANEHNSELSCVNHIFNMQYIGNKSDKQLVIKQQQCEPDEIFPENCGTPWTGVMGLFGWVC